MINKELIESLINIKDTNSRNEKEELLKTAITNNPDLIEILRIVYDDNLVLGVSNQTFYNLIRHEILNQYEDAGSMIAREFIRNATTLKNEISVETLNEIIKDVQRLTGNELNTCLTSVLSKIGADLKTLITRIIVKDLRIGIQLKTVNKVFKELGLPLIKKFEVQLCGTTTLDEWDEYPCIVEEKYDGFRCVIKKKENNITMTSRQGKDVSSFLPEIVEEVKTIKGDFILDGEVMADTFNDIQRRIGRKIDNIKPVPGLHYRVFDILSWVRYDGEEYYDEITEHSTNMYRLNKLKEFIIEYLFKDIVMEMGVKHLSERRELIRISESMIVYDKNLVNDLYQDVIRRNGEGLILKKQNATYDYGSRKNWFKLKPILNATLKVVATEKGKGKYSNTVGALWCEDHKGKVKCKVGSGLTDDIRDYFKNNIKDHYVDVKYSELSQNKNGERSLRFPRFDKIRFDKTKADTL